MSDNFVDQLQAMLADETLKTSLTQDALKKVVTLKETAEKLEKSNETLNAEVVRTRAALDNAFEEVKILGDKLGLWTTREAELLKREKEILKLELTAQFQLQRVVDHQSMVQLIFRNIDIVRNQVGQVPLINKMPDGSQYTATTPINLNETEHRS